ncbi:uncharacterized protein LOC113751926 [Coffea eugenioides]|uniref:RNase H type-1 domain-containing protein n=1 Tax=Coffea arabica TaxID=13443 RepID=A0A6P6VEP1_COFAR|nr:uncharacterized protein LOC113719407 [Coffea arabica]XP_027151873.1 uncharacterized protein LOC113751926 [Coffea eugenioides]
MICPVCGDEIETVEHMLFTCPRAQFVWKLASVRWEGLRELQDNLWRWWEAVAQTGTKESGTEHISLTANIMWNIWKARNKVAFEQKRKEAKEICLKAQQEWQEYEEVRQQEEGYKKTAGDTGKPKPGKEPVLDGVIRISTDAALNARTIRTGKGIVARHWTGEIIRARGVVEQKKGDALMEETLIVRLALQMAPEEGWGKIAIFSDCKTATDYINGNNVQDGILATILEDIADMVQVFDYCTISWMPRSLNTASHRLACFASQLVNDVNWVNQCPNWLKEANRLDDRAYAHFVSNPCRIKC